MIRFLILHYCSVKKPSVLLNEDTMFAILYIQLLISVKTPSHPTDWNGTVNYCLINVPWFRMKDLGTVVFRISNAELILSYLTKHQTTKMSGIFYIQNILFYAISHKGLKENK